MSKKTKYYHIFIGSDRKFSITNITDLEPHYSILFEPYQRRIPYSATLINGTTLYITDIYIMNIYKTDFPINNISEVYLDERNSGGTAHDSEKGKHDISAEILAEATQRISKPPEVISMVILSNRVLGISVCLISLLSVISAISGTGILGKTQLGVSSFIFIESLPLVLFGKWEWNNFGKLATLVGIGLTIALPLLTS
jgi:hypothetical protein